MKVYGVVGWKNWGKTKLVERLVAEITARGHSVSTVKHAHHAFDIDHEGKDSWRHRKAGAAQVLVASKQRWALMTELRGAPEPPLSLLLAQLSPVDLVIIEGFKGARGPKIEIYREGADPRTEPALSGRDADVRARVSDCPVAGDASALPHFHRDDIGAIADFILTDCGLTP